MSCNTEYNLCINQFSSYRLSCQFADSASVPLDISSWRFSGSLKDSYKAVTSIASFTASVASLPSASVLFYLSPEQTALLVKPQYYYDIIAEVSGSSPREIVRLLEGTAQIDLGVTRGS